MQTKLSTISKLIATYLEKTENSSKLLKLTLSGIVITFTVLLFSCQSLPQSPNFNRPIPQAFPSEVSDKGADRLFLQRSEVQIRNREQGSSTGSIWADAQDPRTLTSDAAPSKEGQTITVVIPDELQFSPQSVTSVEKKSDAKDDKKQSSKNENGIQLSDPDFASPSLQLSQAPMKEFKMQIVGFEPGGDVYLRGTRRFSGATGDETTAMVLAKVPRRYLNGYSIDARDLTDVAVNENIAGKLREYSAPGWDEMVSRRLAGFSPDLKSEMGALDGLRDEIKIAQKALREQAQANELERERLRKERERLESQGTQARAPETQANPTPANTDNAATAPESDKK
ncbi:MAG: hypothetical protein RJB13_1519 [Pseudomonadota bacterium]|jgi:hypothetical protein